LRFVYHKKKALYVDLNVYYLKVKRKYIRPNANLDFIWGYIFAPKKSHLVQFDPTYCSLTQFRTRASCQWYGQVGYQMCSRMGLVCIKGPHHLGPWPSSGLSNRWLELVVGHTISCGWCLLVRPVPSSGIKKPPVLKTKFGKPR
jgi:hypothetical protein